MPRWAYNNKCKREVRNNKNGGNKMKIRINETQELKELNAIDDNGIEWTQDLVAGRNIECYDEDGIPTMTLENFDWWADYIATSEADEAAVEELAEELDMDSQEIWERINRNMGCDLDEEHWVIQNVLGEIREEQQ